MAVPRIVVSLCLTSCWAIAAQADTIKLNVRSGLWEMTTTGDVSGAPPVPPELLARLPPDRRARMEAAMGAAMSRAKKSHTATHCVTEKDLQRGFEPEKVRGAAQCHQTVVSNSGNAMDVREECSGSEKVSGHFHFEAVSPEAMNGSIQISVSRGSQTMTIHRVLHAKWLSADCSASKRGGR
jgi:hypothetical protein